MPAGRTEHPGAQFQCMELDSLRSWYVGCATARQLIEDPEHMLALAWANLEQMAQTDAAPTTWLRKWDRLLAGSVPGIVRALTSVDELSVVLRQYSPFAGLLDPEESRRLYEAALRDLQE